MPGWMRHICTTHKDSGPNTEPLNCDALVNAQLRGCFDPPPNSCRAAPPPRLWRAPQIAAAAKGQTDARHSSGGLGLGRERTPRWPWGRETQRLAHGAGLKTAIVQYTAFSEGLSRVPGAGSTTDAPREPQYRLCSLYPS